MDHGHLRAGRQRRRGRVSEGWTRQSAGVSGLGVASSHLRYSVAFVRHLVDCPRMYVHAHARRVYHNDVFCCVLRLQSNEFWCASFPGVLKGYVTVGVGASGSAVAGVVSFFGWPMLRVFGWPMLRVFGWPMLRVFVVRKSSPPRNTLRTLFILVLYVCCNPTRRAPPPPLH